MSSLTKIEVLYKTCSVCSINKSITEFYFRKEANCYHSYCNTCRWNKQKKYRETNLEQSRQAWLRTYGLTISQYNEMFLKQEGKCKCCNIHQSQLIKRLYVDHCHATKKVRGLLCQNCNTSLGLVKDNINTLKNMIEYLNNV